MTETSGKERKGEAAAGGQEEGQGMASSCWLLLMLSVQGEILFEIGHTFIHFGFRTASAFTFI